MKITEENYVRELQRKNEDALEFVVKTFGGLLKAVIHRILFRYPEDAEECLYDTILKIWEHSDSYNGSGKFESWAAAIAKYAALDRLRTIRKLQPMENIEDKQVADTACLTEDVMFHESFMELLSCLNEKDQALFAEIFWYGTSIDEAAQQLEMPKDRIYNHISRGKKKIVRHHPDLFRKEEKK